MCHHHINNEVYKLMFTIISVLVNHLYSSHEKFNAESSINHYIHNKMEHEKMKLRRTRGLDVWLMNVCMIDTH